VRRQRLRAWDLLGGENPQAGLTQGFIFGGKSVWRAVCLAQHAALKLRR